MKRSLWKWIFGLALAGLGWLLIVTFGIWIFANVGAVLFRMVFILDADMTVSGIPFAALMENFVGSPLFYAYVVDLIVLFAGMVGLIVTKKKNKRSGQHEMPEV